jgi:LDH2 family malate/lactate/ureidoglycolate dehydrogenase
MSTDVGGIRTVGRPMRTGQTYLAIDVARFMPLETFTARMEELVQRIKGTPTAPGHDEVLVAGDPEWRTEAERRRNGIPINDGNWRDMLKAAERVGVAPPPA